MKGAQHTLITFLYHSIPIMKTSLLLSALFFLLFVAFSTQTLTLAEEYVLDIYGNHLTPGNKYHILDAEDLSRGIEIDQAFGESCPVTVTIGEDAKKVVFYHSEDHEDKRGIKVGDKTDLEFTEVSRCATSGKWNVSVHGEKKYPVVVGPPEGNITMNGTFHISKPEDKTDEYNIAFKFYGKDDYVLMASTQDPEIYSVVFCPGNQYKNLNVMFEPYEIPKPPSPPTPSPPPLTPSPPPPTPSPPPPTPSPPPPTPSPSPPPPSPTPTPSPPPPSPTFVPLIRKVVRYAE